MKPKFQIPPSEYRRLSDEELLRRYRDLREQAAASYLFERYGHIILGICLKKGNSAAAAKSLTEEIFTHILDSERQRHIQDFKSWLLTYVNNYNSKDPGKAIGNHKEQETQNTLYIMSNGSLEKALDHLTADEKRCLQLFYMEHKNYAEVATETGYPLAQIKNLIHAGMQHITTDLRTQPTGLA
jgi:RNA polymerase sigma-70 factor (ECF subfamily)